MVKNHETNVAQSMSVPVNAGMKHMDEVAGLVTITNQNYLPIGCFNE